MKRFLLTLSILTLWFSAITAKTLYFDNSVKNWSTVKAYCWVSSNDSQRNAAWPGVDCSNEGDNIWKITVDDVYDQVIFNNGNGGNDNQTSDLNAFDEHIYKHGGSISGEAYDPGVPPLIRPEAGKMIIYWDNSVEDWANPYIHYWGGGESKWPGVPMSHFYGNVWYYQCSSSVTNCLFNAGDGDSSKTKDMDAYANHIYNRSGDQGEYTGGDTTAPDEPDDTCIYFDNTTSWDDVYCYAWTGSTNNGEWPGIRMEKGKNGLWRYDLGENNYANVIFNNGNGTQTTDQTCEKGYLYTPNGRTTDYKKECDSEEFTGTFVLDGGGEGGEDDRPFTNSNVSPSGTLPILHINLYNSDSTYNDELIDYNLADKNYRKKADYWLEIPANCHSDFTQEMAIGSEESPLKLDIKARGNYTRTGFSKKPFKLKLAVAQNMLNMNAKGAESKHWAILAHADDEMGYLRNFVGFNLGERIGLPWTPRQRPIEVVINGDYRGIYFLTESIRIEDGRIETAALNDSETDPALISGGYLVELDNYDEPDNSSQITMAEKYQVNGHQIDPLRITPDTPEIYSELQKMFVREQFSAMNDIIGNSSKNSSSELWSYMDLDDAVRYYLVMEVISHWEAYHGSTYLFRDRGEGEKWHFSPLWDCGNAFNGSTTAFFYNCDRYGNTWIPSMVRNNMFDAKLKSTWKWFMQNCYSSILADIEAYTSQISAAAARDHQRWGNAPRPNTSDSSPVVDNTNMTARKTAVLNHLNAKINWLKQQWGDYTNGSFSEPARDNTSAVDLPAYAQPGFVEPEVYIYVVNDANWSKVNLYLYNLSGDYAGWPGVELTKDEDKTIIVGGNEYKGVYSFRVPYSYISNANAIFNNGSGTQYPGSGSAGYTVGSNSIAFFTKSHGTPVTAKLKAPYSGTLPVVFVNTENNRDDDIGYDDAGVANATYYISVPTGSSFAAIGNEESQLATEIKGRGSDFGYTQKKTYKLKFASKASPLGMNSSKHFVLASYANDIDGNSFIENWLGHEISRGLGMKWTPDMRPVEFVLNGKYKGLYMLVENIRPAKERVSVNDTDSKKYSPADDWIIEINSAHPDEEVRYSWTEKYDAYFSYTPKVASSHPEYEDANLTVTATQLDGWLQDHLLDIRNAVDYASENDLNTEWTEIIDSEEAAKFYVVQELMDDPTAFTTSFYLWHTTDSKWHFGPVNNFRNSFASSVNSWDELQTRKTSLIHDLDCFDGAFINKLYQNRYFQFYAMSNFLKFYKDEETPVQSTRRLGPAKAAATYSPEVPGSFTDIVSTGGTLDQFTESIEQAAAADANLWKSNSTYKQTYTLSPIEKGYALKNALKANAAYLSDGEGSDWKTAVTGIDEIAIDAESDDNAPVEYFDLMGRRIDRPAKGAVCIRRQGTKVSRIIR